MTEEEYARKLEELDRLLNDPDVPIQPARIWSLLEQIAGERNVRTRESALQIKRLESFQPSNQGESALAEISHGDSGVNSCSEAETRLTPHAGTVLPSQALRPNPMRPVV